MYIRYACHIVCLDIDECAVLNGGCDHQCHNEPGSYTCTCDVGFELQSDNHTCRGKQVPNIQRYRPRHDNPQATCVHEASTLATFHTIPLRPLASIKSAHKGYFY